jgi:hypothetical protein
VFNKFLSLPSTPFKLIKGKFFNAKDRKDFFQNFKTCLCVLEKVLQVMASVCKFFKVIVQSKKFDHFREVGLLVMILAVPL